MNPVLFRRRRSKKRIKYFFPFGLINLDGGSVHRSVNIGGKRRDLRILSLADICRVFGAVSLLLHKKISPRFSI